MCADPTLQRKDVMELIPKELERVRDAIKIRYGGVRLLKVRDEPRSGSRRQRGQQNNIEAEYITKVKYTKVATARVQLAAAMARISSTSLIDENWMWDIT